LYLKNEKKVAASSQNLALSALKFLYRHTLKRPCPMLAFIKPEQKQKLPVVLSRAELHRVLAQVKKEKYRVCLSTIYSCGLRLKEGVRLPVRAIDSRRMVVHIQQGKGRKDRYVPLPERTLAQMRRLWRSHRDPEWLFPGREVRPMDHSSVQKAFRAALQASGVGKAATVHTLRHSYATHLVEAGVSLRLVQQYLGHSSLQATMLYVHLTPNAQQTAVERINQLMVKLP
jgi:site-specific recombinase XerD